MLRSSKTKRRPHRAGKTMRRPKGLPVAGCALARQSQCWPLTGATEAGLIITVLSWRLPFVSGPQPLAKWLLRVHLCRSRCQDSRQLVLMVPTYEDWKRHLQFPIAVMMTTAEPFEGKPLCFSTTRSPCLETAAEASLEVCCSCWLLPGKGGILKKPETDQRTPRLQHGRGQSIAGKGIRKGWRQNLHPTQAWRNVLHWHNQSFLLIYPAKVAVLIDFRKDRGIGLIS